MTQRPRSAATLAALLLGAALCVTPRVEGAVATVDNGAEPAEGQTVLQLEELWRIGGIDDEENLLGVVNRALADDDGNIYLLDIQLTEVLVYSPDGQYLQSLGRAGEGPGEIRRASDVLFLPDGTVGLVQGFPGKIVKVQLDGTPAGELRPGGGDPSAGGFFGLRAAATTGDRLVLSGLRVSRGENTRTARHFVADFSLDGAQLLEFAGKTSEREFRAAERSEMTEFFPHAGGWALAPDGRVLVAPQRNAYAIDVYAPDGTHERTFGRSYESWKRTDKELERARDSLTPRRRRNRGQISLVMEATERDILKIRCDDAGRIWVLPSRGIRGQPAGIHSTWDVFGADGLFEQQIRISFDGDGERDALFFVGDDRVILVKEHADALRAFAGGGGDIDTEQADLEDVRPLEVICYRRAP